MSKMPIYAPKWKLFPATVAITPAMRRHVPLEIRRAVFERDGFGCHYCGSQHRLTIDHVKPYSQGGTHDPANLITACYRCNIKRNDKRYEDFRASVTFCVVPRIQNDNMAFAQIRARIEEIDFQQLCEAVSRIQLP